jgi:hypothetical protein
MTGEDAEPVRPLLSIINDGLLSDNLERAINLLDGLANEIRAINTRFTNNVVPANPYTTDMEERVRLAAEYLKMNERAIRPAAIAATDLSDTIDKMKKNTYKRQKRYRDVQQLEKGTD